ncbi:cobalamin biosynthesis protein CbiM [Clostridia bacterium]|nr:cobalamin biosynthesis protein CbiM [Clostridia bacterium]
MHMADALLSAVVGGTMCAVSGSAIVGAVSKIKKDDLTEKKIPIMAVAGAFVFAAQMINFTIPGTGSSGHIGGGVLLAGLLGPFPAFLAITAVLIIQCLFFADGGLLALGCNIFNMGVIPCLLVYPLLCKPILKKKITAPRITASSIAAAVVALQLGAFAVVVQTQASGITELPFGVFLLLMQPIHLAIGLVEGIVTASVLCFVYKMRPELLESTMLKKPLSNTVSIKRTVAIFAAITIIVGGGLSAFASQYPDGLEWSMQKAAGSTELKAKDKTIENSQTIQNAIAVMPDYKYKSQDSSPATTPTAGLIGGALVFALAAGTGVLISKVKKNHHKLPICHSEP